MFVIDDERDDVDGEDEAEVETARKQHRDRIGEEELRAFEGGPSSSKKQSGVKAKDQELKDDEYEYY